MPASCWNAWRDGPAAGSGVVTAQQAHFTALDGTVRVKKGNGNSLVPADYNIPLEKGDVVQTGSEGMAKVVFNDGTSYTVKQDSLIVIEENSANDQQQTNVAVAVSTGTVDLSTATYSQGSKSQVIVAGATASLAPESAAQVHNDPKTDQHEILMKKGTGEVTRNGETVQLANWEKVSFQGPQSHMEKAKEIGPPTPISPANMAPIFSSGEARRMWSFPGRRWRMQSVTGCVSPAILIFLLHWSTKRLIQPTSPSPVSAKVRTTGWCSPTTAREKSRWRARRTASPSFPKGSRHGSHRSGTGSVYSAWTCDRSNRQDADRGSGDGEWQRGSDGRSDGSFHYFTPPLPTGEAVITVTAQTAQGGVNTQQKKIIIQ